LAASGSFNCGGGAMPKMRAALAVNTVGPGLRGDLLGADAALASDRSPEEANAVSSLALGMRLGRGDSDASVPALLLWSTLDAVGAEDANTGPFAPRAPAATADDDDDEADAWAPSF